MYVGIEDHPIFLQCESIGQVKHQNNNFNENSTCELRCNGL